MADLERRFLSALLRASKEEQMRVMGSHIDERFFSQRDREYAFMRDFFVTHDKLPKPKTVARRFKGFRVVKTQEPLEFYEKTLLDREAFNTINDMLGSVRRHMESPDLSSMDKAIVAVQQMSDRVAEIRASGFSMVDISRTAAARMHRYSRRSQQGYVISYPSPWKTFNDNCRIVPGNLITILARPAVGKTFMCTVWGASLWKNFKKRVLFVTPEMSREEIEDRLDCYCAGVDWANFLKGRLSSKDGKKLKKWFKNPPEIPMFVTGEDELGRSGSGAVREMIRQFKPDIVFVDAAESLDEGGADRMTNIMRAVFGLKKAAKRTHVPVIASFQFNRRAEKEDGETRGTIADVGWTDEIVQRSDFMLAIQGHRESEQRDVSLLKGRNSPLASFPIHFKHSPRLDLSEIRGIGAEMVELVC